MRVTVATIGSRGDVEPALALAIGLRDGGHQVRFVAPPEHRAFVAERGLDHLDLHPMIADLETPDENQSLAARIRKFKAGREHVIKQFDKVIEHSRETEFLAASITFAPAALSVRDLYGIPVCLLCPTVPFVRTSAYPNPWLPPLPFGRLSNRLSYLLFEQLMWQTVRSRVNRWRRKSLSLPAFPFFGFFSRIYSERIPFLVGVSRHAYPVPEDLPAGVRVTGRWFLKLEESYRPPEKVARFLSNGKPPLCITFGSNPIADKEKTLSALVDSLKATGRSAILVGARSELGQSRDFGDTMVSVDSIPFSWLFPQTDLVIHHGGAGVVACCLQAGVPSIVIANRSDQLAFGRRLFQLGLAPKPMLHSRLTTGKLISAINSVVHSKTMSSEAERIGRKIRTENGVADAVAHIDRFLK